MMFMRKNSPEKVFLNRLEQINIFGSIGGVNNRAIFERGSHKHLVHIDEEMDVRSLESARKTIYFPTPLSGQLNAVLVKIESGIDDYPEVFDRGNFL